MQISFTVPVKQLKRIRRKLEKLPGVTKEEVHEALIEAGETIMVPKVKELAPVGDLMFDPLEFTPGALRESIHVEVMGKGMIAITDGVHYGIYKELGHMMTERAIKAFRMKMKKLRIPIIPEMAKGPHWVAGTHFMVTGVRSSIPKVKKFLKQRVTSGKINSKLERI